MGKYIKENSWPNNRRQALNQSDHIEWNRNHYPGTRQLCSICGETTGRCEDDSIYPFEDNIDPVCEECMEKIFAP